MNKFLSAPGLASSSRSRHIRRMPKGPKEQKRPADMNLLAKAIVDIATGEAEENAPTRGRPGGLKGGEARAGKLTAEKRREIAKKAAERRWRSEGCPD